jgi:beta-glucanase (GH16 family)
VLAVALLSAWLPVAAAAAEWELVWSDEFAYAGAPDPAKWEHELGGGGWGNGEVQTYTDSLENSRVEDGRLIIEARQKTDTRVPSYTSARLVTRGLGEWKYGRFEARVKLPRTTGTWSAVWMLAAERVHSPALWPDNGEIDIMEHVGYEEDPVFKALRGEPELPNIHGTLHTFERNGRDNQGIGGKTYLADATSAFHVYAVNWTEDRIEFEIDGEVYNTIYRADLVPARNPPDDPWRYWPFNQRFFLILNIAVGGDWGGHFNSTFYPGQSPYGGDGIDHDGEWPQRMEVDYVRVYAPAEAPANWKGLAVDAQGNADTGDWLGPINVTHAPWIYSHRLGRYIYPWAAQEEDFMAGSGWIWLPR